MKKRTKILTAFLIILTLISCFAISCFATDGENQVDGGENFFTSLYSTIYENADKIFSILAFIGAIIISIAYKKGLFPFVEKALSALTGTVSTLREETEKNNTENLAFISELTKKLTTAEGMLKGFEQKIKALEEKLSEASLIKDKNEEFRSVMLAEVEMLYDIFISSSLPQYQKDKVGEAYLKMKAKLGGDGENEA